MKPSAELIKRTPKRVINSSQMLKSLQLSTFVQSDLLAVSCKCSVFLRLSYGINKLPLKRYNICIIPYASSTYQYLRVRRADLRSCWVREQLCNGIRISCHVCGR